MQLLRWLIPLCSAVQAFAQATIRVPLDAPTIQAGVLLAEPGDTVLVAPGRYNELVDFLGKAITVRSEAGPAATTLDGAGFFAAVVMFRSGEGPDSVLDGFTVTGGNNTYSDSFGGGISCMEAGLFARPTIRDCVIRGNRSTATGGGGVGGNPILEDCTIADNTSGAGPGGGVWGTPVVRRCIVQGNDAYDGGGVYFQGSGGLIEDSLVLQNAAIEGTRGAGIYVGGSGTIIRRCLIAGNQSHGNGMTTVDGAGVHASPGALPSIERCTIADNLAFNGYPGSDHLGGVAGAAALVDCILRGNSFLQLEAGLASVRYSNVSGGFPGSGNIDSDALFVDPASLDYHLQVGSPCIDAGDPASTPDVDGSRADMGALPHYHAAVIARIGSGLNRPCFTVLSQPVVGTTFVLRVDASLHPGALLSGFTAVDRPLPAGIVYPFGELLIDVFGGRDILRRSRPSTGFLDDFSLDIPAEQALVGRVGYFQAWVVGGGVELCNGLDVVLGN